MGGWVYGVMRGCGNADEEIATRGASRRRGYGLAGKMHKIDFKLFSS
jgi:hypothetical protein